MYAPPLFGVVEGGQGVQVSPVCDARGGDGEFGGSVLAAGYVALAPEGPAGVAGDVAALGAHCDVVVESPRGVFEREEV